MGISNNDGIKSKAKAGGTAKAISRLASLGQSAGGVPAAAWDDVHPNYIVGIVVECTKRGGAASFGLSRDKNVFNLTIFMDGERHTSWIKAGLGAEEELEALMHALAALPE